MVARAPGETRGRTRGDGAGGRTRTGTPLRAGDFESPASTSFTTPARNGGGRVSRFPPRVSTPCEVSGGRSGTAFALKAIGKQISAAVPPARRKETRHGKHRPQDEAGARDHGTAANRPFDRRFRGLPPGGARAGAPYDPGWDRDLDGGLTLRPPRGISFSRQQGSRLGIWYPLVPAENRRPRGSPARVRLSGVNRSGNRTRSPSGEQVRGAVPGPRER